MEEVDKTLRVVIVEDNPADVFFFREALAQSVSDASLEVFVDGLSAWDRLEKAANDARLKPDIVVLDLNVPGMTGRDILGQMRVRPDLKDVPIAVLTGSLTDDDIPFEFPELRLLFRHKTFIMSELEELVKEMLEFAGYG